MNVHENASVVTVGSGKLSADQIRILTDSMENTGGITAFIARKLERTKVRRYVVSLPGGLMAKRCDVSALHWRTIKTLAVLHSTAQGFGVWIDDGGLFHFDTFTTFDDLETAMHFGEKWSQIAIFDLMRGKTINVHESFT